MFRKLKFGVALGFLGALCLTGLATAESLGPINFECGYTAGNINSQNGWSKTGRLRRRGRQRGRLSRPLAATASGRRLCGSQTPSPAARSATRPSRPASPTRRARRAPTAAARRSAPARSISRSPSRSAPRRRRSSRAARDDEPGSRRRRPDELSALRRSLERRARLLRRRHGPGTPRDHRPISTSARSPRSAEPPHTPSR